MRFSNAPAEAVNVIEAQSTIASDLSKKIRTWLTQEHPTWKPKYPMTKKSRKPAGPPPLL